MGVKPSSTYHLEANRGRIGASPDFNCARLPLHILFDRLTWTYTDRDCQHQEGKETRHELA
ncbi:hypothetical protein D3OALGA1CA_4187 [Olavius algarvensis associated proteobacterium Delta 3]|nr:hypothetical protein D3OALGB2SA_1399 [Olavius algarvensis associated proteobacterium Delta 3]CAB5146793.1 hypothetical protein D3OALGA1CA_4187 [Olavius algarvensis associated proteobacterium Delta 3]